MKFQSRILGVFALILSCSSLLAMESASKNIAVFGGGGVNAYSAHVLAAHFAKVSGKKFKEIFGETWSISGGTIPGTMLMLEKFSDAETVGLFQKTVGDAFPSMLEFLDWKDEAGDRRSKFEKYLSAQIGEFKFATGARNRFVYIASSPEGKPVYFCDPDKALIGSPLRCSENTSCVEGIIGSSCYSTTRKIMFFGVKEIDLFKKGSQKLLPNNEDVIICDGGDCREDGKLLLDGFTPTPLVIEYLRDIPGKHNVVVFDNGGPVNDAFRKTLNFGEDGVGLVWGLGSEIRVFIISIDNPNFTEGSINKSAQYLNQLESLANAAATQEIFTTAVNALKSK